jgi:glutamyl-tRNA reductase
MQGKLQSLSPEQRSAVEALTRGLINKVLHQPLQAMKAAARNGDLTVAEAVRQIFGLTLQSGGSAPQSDAEPRKEAAAESVSGERVSEAAERDAVEATRR